MEERLIKAILTNGVWYTEYGEKELKHTCNLKFERVGNNQFAFCNKNNYFPEHTYKKNWWLKKDRSE